MTALGLGLTLALGGMSARADYGLVDDGRFFSEQARASAKEAIQKIAKDHKFDLYVETMESFPIPAGQDAKDKQKLDRWVTEFAAKKGREKSVKGLYFLISKEPAKYRIELDNKVVGNRSNNQSFRQAVEQAILPHLKTKDFDKALSALVSTVESHVPNHNKVSHGGNQQVAFQGGDVNPLLGWLCMGALVVAGIFLVMGLIRGIGGMMGGGGPGGGMGPGMGGGGFFSNFLGGMFGAAAGMWIYDSFFGHGASHAWGSGSTPTSSETDMGSDSGYSSSGGDWGGSDSSSSGGDWGGGGGDWGGGGGDFGGGGGDY